VALLTTKVNTFGGQWFDMGWKPQINTAPWKDAVEFYIDLLRKYGPPDAAGNSFNENLALLQAGKCAVWIDATIAASYVSDPRQSKVAGRVSVSDALAAAQLAADREMRKAGYK